jgi:hypothetical protein
MADTGKGKDTKPVYDAELPADEEFEEESKESSETEAPAKSASSGLRGMFGMSRRGAEKAPAGKAPAAKVVTPEPAAADEADDEASADEDAGKDEADEEVVEGGEAETDEAEGESDRAALAAVTASEKGSRFSLGRGRKAEEEADKRRGSVREAHDRVRIDDRPSAIYALICAAALLGVIALSWLGGVIPKSVGPSLAPLVVPTGHPAASASVTPVPSVTIAPSVSTAP